MNNVQPAPRPVPKPAGQTLGVLLEDTGESHRDPVNDPANDPANERQKWFIGQLLAGARPKAEDLAAQWDISLSTAKRDISELKKQGLVEFVGVTKKGYYRII